jgi:hypothetical protein
VLWRNARAKHCPSRQAEHTTESPPQKAPFPHPLLQTCKTIASTAPCSPVGRFEAAPTNDTPTVLVNNKNQQTTNNKQPTLHTCTHSLDNSQNTQPRKNRAQSDPLPGNTTQQPSSLNRHTQLPHTSTIDRSHHPRDQSLTQDVFHPRHKTVCAQNHTQNTTTQDTRHHHTRHKTQNTTTQDTTHHHTTLSTQTAINGPTLDNSHTTPTIPPHSNKQKPHTHLAHHNHTSRQHSYNTPLQHIITLPPGKPMQATQSGQYDVSLAPHQHGCRSHGCDVNVFVSVTQSSSGTR